MALTVSTDAIIEKLSGTAGADSQVHSITSGQIIVCVGCKVVDGGFHRQSDAPRCDGSACRDDDAWKVFFFATLRRAAS